MPDEFRFLLLCLSPQKVGDVVTLGGIVNDIRADDLPTDIALYAVVGAILRPPHWGKSLDLMAWQLGNKGERETLVKYVGTPLIMPEEAGPVVLPYRINVPIWTPGIYGFDLFDRDGIFGEKEGLLATYLYSVSGGGN